MIVTRKIQVAVLSDNEQQKAQAYGLIRELNNQVWRAANQIISDQWFYETFENKVIKPDQEKLSKLEKEISGLYEQRKTANEKQILKLDKAIESLKKKKNSLLSEAKKAAKAKLKDLFEVSRSQLSWRMLAQKYPDWGSYIFDALNQKVNQDFGNDYINVLQGKRSIRSYRQGMPIPFRARGMQFYKAEGEKDQYTISWLKGINFVIVFGRDKSSRQSEIDKIIEGEYSYGDSALQVKGKKLFLLLALKHPDQPKTVIDTNSITVEAGIQIPVKVSSQEGETEFYGNADDLIKFRLQLQRRRQKVQKDLVMGAGGHGRKKKLKNLDRFTALERNFIRTYNHKLSKQVIDFALKHRAGTIMLYEMQVTKEEDPEDKKKFLNRNWAGYELSSMIAYKAKIYHIGVHIEKIDTKAAASAAPEL